MGVRFHGPLVSGGSGVQSNGLVEHAPINLRARLPQLHEGSVPKGQIAPKANVRRSQLFKKKSCLAGPGLRPPAKGRRRACRDSKCARAKPVTPGVRIRLGAGRVGDQDDGRDMRGRSNKWEVAYLLARRDEGRQLDPLIARLPDKPRSLRLKMIVPHKTLEILFAQRAFDQRGFARRRTLQPNIEQGLPLCLPCMGVWVSGLSRIRRNSANG